MVHVPLPEIFVLDSTVFLEGYSHLFLGKFTVTTPQVAEEMRSGKAAIEFDRSRKSGLDIVQPPFEVVEEVLKRRGKTQDKMSTADVSVVAAALALKKKGKNPVVVSDDYAVQNLCAHFDLKFLPVSKTGIEKKFDWVRKCSACGHESRSAVCEICGSQTRFVPKKAG